MAVFTVQTSGAGDSAGKNGIDHVKITRVVTVYDAIVDSNSKIIDTSGEAAPASEEQTGVVCDLSVPASSAQAADKADDGTGICRPEQSKKG